MADQPEGQPEPEVWIECACGASQPLASLEGGAEPTCAECGASLAADVSIARDARAAGVIDRLARPQPAFARANGAPGRCV